MGLLARFWRSNALNEIGFYHWLNEKILLETDCVFMARRGAEEGWKVKDQNSALRSIIIITFCK